MVWRCRGGDLVQLHLLLKYTIVTTASQKLDIHSGVFHTYRCKSCLAGLLAVSSLPSFCLVKNLPLFAWRHPGIVLVSAAACTVLVLLSLSLSHLFQSVFLCDEDEPLPGKAQGLSFDEQVRVCYKSSTVLFLFPWNPSPFSLGEGRWFSPWQCSALPVTGARTEPARPGVSPLGWSGRRLGAFSPRGRGAGGERREASSRARRHWDPAGRAFPSPRSAGSGSGWRDLCPPAQPLHAAFRSGFFCSFIAETQLFLQWLCRGLWHVFAFKNVLWLMLKYVEFNACMIFALQDLPLYPAELFVV